MQDLGASSAGGAYCRAAKALHVYVVCYMQSKLGYFVNLKKSQLQPVSTMVHLGFGISSESLSFWIPEKKKHSFAEVREEILSAGLVSLKTLQRFIGKCQSFALVFPAASLFVRECCALLPSLDDISPRPYSEAVRDEVLFWRFVDSFSESIPWRHQRHLTIQRLGTSGVVFSRFPSEK